MNREEKKRVVGDQPTGLTDKSTNGSGQNARSQSRHGVLVHGHCRKTPRRSSNPAARKGTKGKSAARYLPEAKTDNTLKSEGGTDRGRGNPSRPQKSKDVAEKRADILATAHPEKRGEQKKSVPQRPNRKERKKKAKRKTVRYTVLREKGTQVVYGTYRGEGEKGAEPARRSGKREKLEREKKTTTRMKKRIVTGVGSVEKDRVPGVVRDRYSF